MITVVIDVHCWNEKFPMILTVFGIVTEVKVVTETKAESPIATVVKPPIMEGSLLLRQVRYIQ